MSDRQTDATRTPDGGPSMASGELKADRRGKGAFYTPRSLADYVTGEALRGCSFAKSSQLSILDPACGDGVLLASALHRILDRSDVPPPACEERLAIARRHIFGVDRCSRAAAQARRVVAAVALSADPRSDVVEAASKQLVNNIRCGDALLEEVFDPELDRSFDVVVANPPFVNIRRLSQTYSPVMKQALRDRYVSATGNFDLYVLFIERTLQLLRAGGRASIVTPNKLATLKYARACRQLIRDETILETVLDASSVRLFEGADVYPHVWVFETGKARDNHMFSVRRANSADQLECPITTAELDQRALSLSGFVLSEDLPVEARVATTTLCDWGVVHSGASGFTAHRLLEHLVEADAIRAKTEPMQADSELIPASEEGERASNSGWEFIVSGNIDRYQIELGRVRYMKHRFHRPRLQPSCPLTPIKQRLYSNSKIVLAGMSKRLEAALDDRGLALGVQVYAVASTGEHTDYLLGLLNSKLLSHLFRLRFAAKRLSDNYLAINKTQLDQLPIAMVEDRRSCTIRDRIASCVQDRRRLGEMSTESARLDQQIDRLVFDLYRLTAEEARAVDQAVA